MMGLVTIFRCAIAASALSLMSPAAAAEPKVDFAPAFALFNDRKFDEAAEAYGRIADDFARRYPTTEERRYYCGQSGAETLLYLAMAARDDVTASALGPDWCEALFMQAYSYVEAGRVDLALAPLARAAELAPYNAQYANELGFVYRSLGRLDEAMASYQRALAGLEANPDTQLVNRRKAVALRGIGWIHAERQQWDEAEKALNESLEIEPGNENALAELQYVAENRPSD
jgi:tetratricopeptide (TPR) repeat protein